MRQLLLSITYDVHTSYFDPDISNLASFFPFFETVLFSCVVFHLFHQKYDIEDSKYDYDQAENVKESCSLGIRIILNGWYVHLAKDITKT